MATSNCCGKTTGSEINTVSEPIDVKKLEFDFLVNKESRSQQRIAVCLDCEHLKKPLNRCELCGCFMNIKTRIYKSKCPKGLW
jgi:hypothetical protein